MRYSEIIEHRELTEQVVDHLTMNRAPVFRNPSRSEFRVLQANLAAGEDEPETIRAILDPESQDLYVWDGFYAAHGALKDRYGLPNAFHLLIRPGRVVVLTLWRYERQGIDAARVRELVEQNEHLRRILGTYEVDIRL